MQKDPDRPQEPEGPKRGAPSTDQTTESVPPPSKGPKLPGRIGHYRVLELISDRGGMGIVYLAEQEEPLRRRVALKTIKPGLDSAEVMARFESERQALAILNHPNIARVFDAGVTDQGRAYFVMEYVPGVPITEYCDKHRLNTAERLDLFIQVCQAIHHAHQKGIIHRDIKPSNALVAVQDGKPMVKVIDFGVAKALDRHLTERTLFTRQGTIVGTPEYMSPEQAEMSGLDVDTTTDVYSLGVVLYELLVGVLPFDPRSLREAGYAEMQRIIREVEPPRPTTRLTTLGATAEAIASCRRVDLHGLRKLIQGDLEWIILRAIEKDRTRRYPSASEFAQDIRRHLQDEPVLAGPPGTRYRLQKFARRHKGVVMAVGSVVGALALGLVVSLVLYRRAEQARLVALERTYAADIAAVEAAAERGDVAEARRLLGDCPVEYRGWEWSYLSLRADCSVERTRIAGLESDFRGAAINAGLNLVALACSDSTVRLCDLTSGRPIRVLHGHTGAVVTVAFSPHGDLLASGSSDSTIRLWRVSDGRMFRVLRGHTSEVSALSFSRSGSRLASAESPLQMSSPAHVWEIPSGRIVSRLSCDQGSVALSPDGRRAAATVDFVMKEFEVESGKEIRTLGRVPVGATSIQYSPDEASLVAVCGSKIYSWDLREGKPAAVFMPPEDSFDRAVYGPDGRWILATAEGRFYLLDPDRGHVLHGPFLGNEALILCAAFLPASNRVATVSRDEMIREWNPSVDGGPLRLPWTAGSAVAFSPHGDQLVAGSLSGGSVFGIGSYDCRIRVWNTASWDTLPFLSGHRGRVRSVVFSPDGAHVASTGRDGTARVWDAERGRLLRTHSLGAAGTAVAFSPDNRVLAVGTRNDSIELLNPDSGDSISTVAMDGAVRSISFCLGGRALLVRTLRLTENDVQARLSEIEWRSGRRLWTTAPDLAASTASVSPDGRKVLCGTIDGKLVLLDCRDGRVLQQMAGSAETINATAWSPDGSRAAYSDYGAQVTVLDPMHPSLRVHLKPLNRCSALAFSPDGSTLVGLCIPDVLVWQAIPASRIVAPAEPPPAGTEQVLPFVRTLLGDFYIPGEEPGRAGARLKKDPRVPPGLRDRLNSLLQTGVFSPTDLNSFAWTIVGSSGHLPAEYEWGVRAARVALISGPEDDESILNTLGVGLYRLGRYEEACRFLGRADSLCLLNGSDSAYNTVFLALAEERLGAHAEAIRFLRLAQDQIRSPADSGNVQLQGCLREAEASIFRREPIGR